jgi:5'-nucleotidase
MAEIGDVLVVAPDKPQSGMGHAITTNSTLYLNKISKENDGIEEYSCSGTPVDCVKLAVNEILKESRICACLALIMDLTLPSM